MMISDRGIKSFSNDSFRYDIEETESFTIAYHQPRINLIEVDSLFLIGLPTVH